MKKITTYDEWIEINYKDFCKHCNIYDYYDDYFLNCIFNGNPVANKYLIVWRGRKTQMISLSTGKRVVVVRRKEDKFNIKIAIAELWAKFNNRKKPEFGSWKSNNELNFGDICLYNEERVQYLGMSNLEPQKDIFISEKDDWPYKITRPYKIFTLEE